jgi:lipooligosaccharide transport system permease protein
MVLRRNAKVYMRNWKTAFLPPAMEPVIFFMAFGMGLGAYIGMMSYEGHGVEYGTYVAPGLLAYTTFSSSYFEGLYGSYIRMFYQKTWDGMLGTQLELRHILWGEIIWAGCRGGMNATVVMVVLFIFQSLDLISIDWDKMIFLMPLITHHSNIGAKTHPKSHEENHRFHCWWQKCCFPIPHINLCVPS